MVPRGCILQQHFKVHIWSSVKCLNNSSMESCTDITTSFLRWIFISSNVLRGTFNWLLDSLNLILMPLYNLHEQMRPSVRSSYFFTVIKVFPMTYLYKATHKIKIFYGSVLRMNWGLNKGALLSQYGNKTTFSLIHGLPRSPLAAITFHPAPSSGHTFCQILWYMT